MRNKRKVVKSESHTHEDSQKINFGDKPSHADPGDTIEVISDDDNEMVDETARTVANIPGIHDSISGIREILSQETAEEPLFEVAVSADET